MSEITNRSSSTRFQEPRCPSSGEASQEAPRVAAGGRVPLPVVGSPTRLVDVGGDNRRGSGARDSGMAGAGVVQIRRVSKTSKAVRR